MSATPRVLALSGGVGGAKLVAGLASVLPAEALTVAVNVGDDFEHLGLRICPDFDTVLYTLAGVVHPQQGWGRADESWQTQDELRRLGGPTWFQLGDRDIALHLLRRDLLDRGQTLSEVCAALRQRLGVAVPVLPISDAAVRTIVDTDEGELAFQDYFVRRRAAPRVQALRYAGAADATLAPGVRAALDDPLLAGVVLCPSNPYLSIAPMLAIPELRARLCALTVPVLAVSPIVGGKAIKGPTAKIMAELQVSPGATVIAGLYADFVDRVLVDTQDAALVQNDERFVVADTVMTTAAHRSALARVCVELLHGLRAGRSGIKIA